MASMEQMFVDALDKRIRQIVKRELKAVTREVDNTKPRSAQDALEILALEMRESIEAGFHPSNRPTKFWLQRLHELKAGY